MVVRLQAYESERYTEIEEEGKDEDKMDVWYDIQQRRSDVWQVKIAQVGAQ